MKKLNEHITDLKKISLTLRDINQIWIEDGNYLKVIDKIIELDKKIYGKISKLEEKELSGVEGCGKEFIYLKDKNGQITMPCGTSDKGITYLCKECRELTEVIENE